MSFNMSLWAINEGGLTEINRAILDKENRLEDWLEKDISLLDLDLLLIGRQVFTGFGGKIDLLGIDQEGDLVILELKRDKTPREVVAQILDYASWVRELSLKEINAIAAKFLNKDLSTAFTEYFGSPLPEKINTNHSMVIVASELDESSERIVRYLADEYNIDINAIFFNFFKHKETEILGRAWLMNPEKVKKNAADGVQPPWQGYWYVNVGEGENRNWDDNMQYGFISAGQGNKFSRQLKRFGDGDKIFAYLSGHGYVGYGEVTQTATMIKEFRVDGKPLLDYNLKALHADANKDDPVMSEWVIGVKWLKKFPREEAKSFKGIFAYPSIVCKLRNEATVKFLEKEFVEQARGV